MKIMILTDEKLENYNINDVIDKLLSENVEIIQCENLEMREFIERLVS